MNLWLSTFRNVTWLLFLAVAAGLFFPPGAAAENPPGGQNFKVYLPAVTKGGDATNPPPPVEVTKGGLFFKSNPKTNSASAAVDANGGMHFAFADFGPLSSHPQANYFYCAGGCDNPANWHGVLLGDYVDEVQLALTPAGQPRLLITTSRVGESGSYGNSFHYAACNQNCTNPANWSMTLAAASAKTDTGIFDQPQHYFALDALGRPRLVYNDEWPNDSGVYYAACDTACNTNPANWSKTKIGLEDQWSTSETFEMPVLKFNSQNQPRLLANITTLDNTSGLYYLECNANCASLANWQRVRLLDRGNGPDVGWDMELDAAGRPRMIFYQGSLDGGGGNSLQYAWCNGSCLTDSNWTLTHFGLPQGDGLYPDLALTGAGQPRIAYKLSGGAGLGYLWCNVNCHAGGGQWSAQPVEASSVLDNDFPIPPPNFCTNAYWIGGYRPSLALDSQGNPRIGYDALHLFGGGTCATGSDFRAARYTFFPQP